MNTIPQSKEEVARVRINSLIQRATDLDRQSVDLILSTLTTVWKPMTPLTTQDILSGMGEHAAEQFATHGRRLAEVWADPSRKPLLIASATERGIKLTEVNGAPVFEMMKPYTLSPNGTVTLT